MSVRVKPSRYLQRMTMNGDQGGDFGIQPGPAPKYPVLVPASNHVHRDERTPTFLYGISYRIRSGTVINRIYGGGERAAGDARKRLCEFATERCL